ncbi:TPA: thiolase domain-containing protein [Candidatus Bathyarchaeota archaeon]|nr:thiolase domain-containing protein [Candidatus Bathyarchaeota archaeon]
MLYAAIIGGGRTRFGELWDRSFEDLILEAGIKAVEGVGLERKDLQAFYVATFLYELSVGQSLVAAELSQMLGINANIIRVENACASGGSAFQQACLAVKSGKYDIVCVGGVEKMTDSYGTITDALATALDPWERFFGFTFPGVYANIMARHMHEYGTTREQIAAVRVKDQRHARTNPNAQFRFETTLEDVMGSRPVCDPIRLFDCSPISDGACAVIVCRPDLAKEYTDEPVYVIGLGSSTDTCGWYSREALTTMKSTILAAREAYAEANVGPDDIGLIELHDCFTIEEIIALEDMGFVSKGEGGRAIMSALETSARGGPVVYGVDGREFVTNLRGGLLGDGHPVGATGVAQVYELYRQLLGQVPTGIESSYGLAHNLGGSGGSSSVTILGV